MVAKRAGIFGMGLWMLVLSGCAGCPGEVPADPDGGHDVIDGSSGGASGGTSSGHSGNTSSGGVSSSAGATVSSSSGSATSGTGEDGGTGSSSSSSGAIDVDAGPTRRDAGPPVVDLEVLPNPAVLDVQPGPGADLALVVNAVLADNTRRPANAPYFRSETTEIGVMNGNIFHTSGERSGTARIRIRAEGLEKRHAIEVHIREVAVEPGSPSGIEGAFGGPAGNPSSAPAMVYPYNDVVIPLNLAPILFQWRSTIGGAWYHLRIEGGQGSLDLYTASPDRVAPTVDAWRRLLQAHSGRTLTVTLEAVQSPGGERYVAAQQIIRLADADLTATVYYWALNIGSIVRIEANSLTPNVLPMNPQGGGNSCFGCHSLSASGRRLAFTFYGGNQPGGVIDPGNPSTNLIGPDSSKIWNFAAISPNDTLLLTNYQRQLHVRDGNSGDVLSSVTNPIATEASHPAWSPAGDRIAYAANITDSAGNPVGWEIDFERSDLVVRRIDSLTGAAGDVDRFIPGNGLAAYYPNFSPQGLFLIYNRGVNSRSGRDDIGLPYPATLEMIDVTFGGDPVTLTRASPGSDSYLATFSPFVEGGYMWVAFFSRRDYGVVLTGRQRQIWVAAIDANPQAGSDPSHPAFWLPGQDSNTQNMSSFFAPVPCVGSGGACETDLGCCDGSLCRPNSNGQRVCTPPDVACALPGDACSADNDCCAGAGPCFDPGTGIKLCTPPDQQCRHQGESCQFDDDCCVGAGTCFGGSGQFVCTQPQDQCRLENQTCTQDSECCAGAGPCFDDGSGVKRCVPPGSQCQQAGTICQQDSDCCAVAGPCFDNGTGVKRCTPSTSQCRQNGQSCALDSDCCVGAGTCFQDPATGNKSCLRPEQRCKLPTEACTTTADCCTGGGAECLTNRQTGEKQCLTPANQCRAEAEVCTSNNDCCNPFFCIENYCSQAG